MKARAAVAKPGHDRGQERGGAEPWPSRRDRASRKGEKDVQHVGQRVVRAHDGRLDVDVAVKRAQPRGQVLGGPALSHGRGPSALVSDWGLDLLQRVDPARRGVRCSHRPDPLMVGESRAGGARRRRVASLHPLRAAARLLGDATAIERPTPARGARRRRVALRATGHGPPRRDRWWVSSVILPRGHGAQNRTARRARGRCHRRRCRDGS
jgi:hypothetical protein